MSRVVTPKEGDWTGVKQAIQQLAKQLAVGAEPTFGSLTLTNLTASSIVGANASKKLESVTIGTGLLYSRPTLSLSHLGIESLTDPGADRILFWDDSESASAWLGLGNSVAITTTVLDTIQDIRTSASPIFAGATIDSIVFGDVYDAQKEPTGFVDRVATLSWNDGDFTLTITGSHDIYIYGVKTTKSTDSIQIANSTGLHWIYYDASGTLAENTVFPGWYLPVIATVYWNTTVGFDKGLVGEERHNIVMDWHTHEYLHNTVGSRFESGLTGTFDDTTITIETGEWHDEDIEHTSSQQTTCNVLYKNGSANWEWDAGVSVYYKLNGTALRYNNGNALADCTSNRYMAMWIFATNDISVPIVALMGQRQDTTLKNARANNTYESLSFGTLPFQEMKLLYRVILRSTGSPPTYTETQDLRAISNLPAGTYIATSHGLLTDLGNDDHTQYIKNAEFTQDSGILVGTGAGTFQEETGATARTSMGLGTGDSPTFANLSLGTGELTCGSINRASGTLAFEIGGTTELSLTSSHLTLESTHLAIRSSFGITFYDQDNSHYFHLTAPNTITEDVSYGWPPADGDADEVLTTNGSGILTWTGKSPTPGGDNEDVQFNDGGVLAGSNNLAWDKNNLALEVIGDIEIKNTNDLRFYPTGVSNYVGFKPPAAIAANKIWVLPNADGNANDRLKTDGSGNLGWIAAGAAFSSKCSVYRNATQAITTSTWTKVQLNTEYYDTDNEFDAVTNYRFQPDVTGYYSIACGLALDTMLANKSLLISIYKNGVAWKLIRSIAGVSINHLVAIVGDAYLLDTDFIELWVYQNNGNNRNVLSNEAYTFMDVHRFA